MSGLIASLALLLIIPACASRTVQGPPQQSLDDRIRAHRDSVQAYNEQARALKADADAVTAETQALSKHSAFPALWKKLEEAVARSMAEEPTDKAKQAARAEEFLAAAGMTPDEEKLRRAMDVVQVRIQHVIDRAAGLERWRTAISSEREAFERDLERRKVKAMESASAAQGLAVLMGIVRPVPVAPRFQTSCTTNRIGSMVYTDCR